MTKSPEALAAAAAAVKGFLSFAEGRALYAAAMKVGYMAPCLEIGSYCGRSTLYLGAACREHQTLLFSVDHHNGSEEQQPGETYFDPALFDHRRFCVDTFGEFRETLRREGLLETVVPVVCPSAVAARFWQTPLSLVFIDGGHALETVMDDYTRWAGHLIPGGYLMFHDIYPDPADGGQAPLTVYRRALATTAYTAEALVGSLGILRRKRSV